MARDTKVNRELGRVSRKTRGDAEKQDIAFSTEGDAERQKIALWAEIDHGRKAYHAALARQEEALRRESEANERRDRDTQRESERHSHFLDLCLLYGDFDRPVFLRAIRDWFLSSATAQELREIRKAVQARARTLKGSGKKGRPRGQDDENFLRRARVTAWRRIVQGWTWERIAESEGMNLERGNRDSLADALKDAVRTLTRRLDHFAVLIWRELPEPRIADDLERLEGWLALRRNQDLLRWRVGLPFRQYPSECRKIVLALAPRGAEVYGELGLTRIGLTRKRRTRAK